jgi:hypothetical protein|tara:strand:- start:510 stop:752 length:243 start_codon:yes stop_codon:yes gene_type:complete
MISNPAKAVYMKFDLAAQLMARDKSENTKDDKLSGGLLRRMNMSKPNGSDTKENEPLDIAMKYFMAIRKERNALKNKQDK